MDDVFQVDSPIVKKTLEEDNYLIEYDNSCLDKSICAIYFSSNFIYYPNSPEVFIDRINEKDHYEFYNNRVKRAYKHIFVRDIQKQWYLGGINCRLDSPIKLLEFLSVETNNYSIIALGSSAGGFAAVFYGSMLNAARIYTFNGQFEVLSLLESSDERTNPILFRNRDSELENYYDIRKFIKDVEIFYFTSMYSKWDKQQYEYIKDIKSIKTIFFRTSHHGIPFLKNALANVLNMTHEQLMDLTINKHSSVLFSFRVVGIFDSICFLMNVLRFKLK
jgi:hypothetical protein